MIRACAAPRGGWDSRLRLVFDKLFWIECLAAGGAYGYVEGVNARYRLHANSMTRVPKFDQVRLEDQLTTLALVQARYPHLGSACRSGRAYVLQQHALLKMRRGELAAARELSWGAVREKVEARRLGLAMVAWLAGRRATTLVRWYDAMRGRSDVLQLPSSR
jgi:hypothetical protein